MSVIYAKLRGGSSYYLFISFPRLNVEVAAANIQLLKTKREGSAFTAKTGRLRWM